MTDHWHDHYLWLIQTPVTDGNFKSHLEAADVATLRRALEFMRGKPNHKGRIQALTRRLKALGENMEPTPVFPVKDVEYGDTVCGSVEEIVQKVVELFADASFIRWIDSEGKEFELGIACTLVPVAP